jgi:hypothetical protein
VFRREVGPPVSPRIGYGHRARFATKRVAHLVDGDVEPALAEFVRCGEPADPPAEHRHGWASVEVAKLIKLAPNAFHSIS